MKIYNSIIIGFCLLFLSITPSFAQEDSDWWHTNYDSQPAIGGPTVSQTKTVDTQEVTTLPVAGNTSLTILVSLTGLIFAGLGLVLLKQN